MTKEKASDIIAKHVEKRARNRTLGTRFDARYKRFENNLIGYLLGAPNPCEVRIGEIKKILEN